MQIVRNFAHPLQDPIAFALAPGKLEGGRPPSSTRLLLATEVYILAVTDRYLGTLALRGLFFKSLMPT